MRAGRKIESLERRWRERETAGKIIRESKRQRALIRVQSAYSRSIIKELPAAQLVPHWAQLHSIWRDVLGMTTQERGVAWQSLNNLRVTGLFSNLLRLERFDKAASLLRFEEH
jgi:hypothetical protein